MTDYPYQTVAIARVRGLYDQRVMRTDDGRWVSARRIKNWWVHPDTVVRDIRPLVVTSP